jgi:hypothetical protein
MTISHIFFNFFWGDKQDVQNFEIRILSGFMNTAHQGNLYTGGW